MNHADAFTKGILFLVSFVFLLILSLSLNIPPVNDEVATLASPAYVLGADWSQTLEAMGGYYFKYGAGMIYYPLMLFIKNPYVLYKAMLTLNCICCSFIPVIVYSVLKKYMGAKRTTSALIGAAAAALPTSCLYALYTRGDVFLTVAPFVCLWLLLNLLQTSYDIPEGNKKKLKRKRVILGILLAFVCAGAFAVHTRGIVVLLAVIVTILASSLILRIKYMAIIPTGVSLVLFLWIDRCLENYFFDALYKTYGTGFSSTQSYDFGALKLIFSADGFSAFIKEAAGTLFNAMVSTGGLVILGVLLGLVVIVMYFRKKSEVRPALLLFGIFAVVICVGTFLMSVIYFFPYVYDLLTYDRGQRSDWLVYGRYIACSLGPCVTLALYLLHTKRGAVYNVFKAIGGVVYVAVAAYFLIKVCPLIDGVSAVSRNFISVAEFVNVDSYGITTAAFYDVGKSFLWAGILGLLIYLVIVVCSLIKRKDIPMWVAALFFTVLSVIITVVNYQKIRISRDEVLVSWTQPVSDAIRRCEAASGYRIYVDDSAKSIKHYQYNCAAFKCCGPRTVDKNEEMFIITSKKHFTKEFYEDDFYVFDDFDAESSARDTVYVKGEGLLRVLKDSGYSLSKYEY